MRPLAVEEIQIASGQRPSLGNGSIGPQIGGVLVNIVDTNWIRPSFRSNLQCKAYLMRQMSCQSIQIRTRIQS